MPIFSFTAYEVDVAYYNGEDGSILGKSTLDISDTDNLLEAENQFDPNNDQQFSIDGGPFWTDYPVDFLDFAVINGGGTEY